MGTEAGKLYVRCDHAENNLAMVKLEMRDDDGKLLWHTPPFKIKVSEKREIKNYYFLPPALSDNAVIYKAIDDEDDDG